MKPTFPTKAIDSVCKWASPQYTIDCFADITTQEACTVTQKIDLDQLFDKNIRMLKDTNMINSLSEHCKLNFGFIRFV